MLTYVGFRRILDGATIELNTDIYPLTEFDPTVAERNVTDRDKMQEHGVWPTFSYRGGLEIHLEGNIFGSDSADYMTNRIALVNGIFGSPDADVTDRRMGTFLVQFDGQGERWETDVAISAWSAPLKALYPSTTDWACTFFSFTPYLVGESSGSKYYIS